MCCGDGWIGWESFVLSGTEPGAAGSGHSQLQGQEPQEKSQPGFLAAEELILG